jgi:hypothetical protein
MGLGNLFGFSRKKTVIPQVENKKYLGNPAEAKICINKIREGIKNSRLMLARIEKSSVNIDDQIWTFLNSQDFKDKVCHGLSSLNSYLSDKMQKDLQGVLLDYDKMRLTLAQAWREEKDHLQTREEKFTFFVERVKILFKGIEEAITAIELAIRKQG